MVITQNTLKTRDSIKLNVSDNNINTSQLDAFKHSFWLAQLTLKIGGRSAIKLGKAHEKGNYRTFKKNKLEDGNSPDKISSDMDLFNNEIGVRIAVDNPEIKNDELIKLVIEEVRMGKMKIVKKDSENNFLNCDGEIISKNSLIGVWENSKCLVSSKSE